MSDYSDTNPPAFPRSYAADGHNGMSLRDWFAGQALIGLIAKVVFDEDGIAHIPHGGDGDLSLEWAAYNIADRMLMEREG